MINLQSNIAKIPSSIKNSGFPLTKIKPEVIEGIQKGIPLFDGERFVKLDDIAFITKNLETLNLFRGCTVGCTHCLKNAKPDKKRTILFEDLERFTDGFRSLSQRLGFDVLNGNKYLSIVDDSNPSDFPIEGLSSKHSVVEAMQLIYKKLNIPTLFVTSGWSKASKYAQENAERLVKEIKSNPDSVEKVEISVNPFLNIMENSRQALKNGEKDKSVFFRNIYTSRMANVISTFIDLFSLDKASIIYRHAASGDGVGEGETKKLYEEIYNKLREIIGSRIEEFPSLSPENLTRFDKSHLIEPSGRARKYFSKEENMKLQSELAEEYLAWQELSPEERKAELRDTAVKCIDINGRVYATKPASRVTFVNTPIEITTPTDIQLNYLNSRETNPVFSDIELD